jgi:pimeloyl-ACP methyl ester carboxylesterase
MATSYEPAMVRTGTATSPKRSRTSKPARAPQTATERGSALLHALSDADDDGYAAVCGALATFDVRDRLPEITVPVLAVAGSHDEVAPPSSLALVTEGVAHGRLVVLDDVATWHPPRRPRPSRG